MDYKYKHPEVNTYKYTKLSADESENNTHICTSPPPAKRQQSKLWLMLGDGQREQAATQPLLGLPGPGAEWGAGGGEWEWEWDKRPQ